MDLNKSIRLAVDTGKVFLGNEQTLKTALNGSAKLVIIAANCPANKKQDLQHYCKLSNIQVLEFNGTGIELGTVCGKPFPISSMSIIEGGNSDILQPTAQEEQPKTEEQTE